MDFLEDYEQSQGITPWHSFAVAKPPECQGYIHQDRTIHQRGCTSAQQLLCPKPSSYGPIGPRVPGPGKIHPSHAPKGPRAEAMHK